MGSGVKQCGIAYANSDVGRSGSVRFGLHVMINGAGISSGIVVGFYLYGGRREAGDGGSVDIVVMDRLGEVG